MKRGLATLLTVLVVLVTATGAQGQDGSGSNSKPSETQLVLATMRGFNRLEARLGQMAKRKGTDVDIRRYGERLYRDHHYANQEVTKVVHADRLSLPSPKTLPAAPKLQAARQQAQQLQQESGTKFDRSFLQLVVQSQQLAISMLKNAWNQLPRGKARRLVSRVVPILQQHVELARQLESGALPG